MEENSFRLNFPGSAAGERAFMVYWLLKALTECFVGTAAKQAGERAGWAVPMAVTAMRQQYEIVLQ
jgi:hypothetical protein